MKRIREKYRTQRGHAKRRGIEFNLSFEEWMDWWGDDLEKRGRGLGKLQMCRKGDKGNYEIGNIYKGTCEENSSLKFKLGFKGREKYLSSEEVDEVLRLLSLGG